MAGLSLTQYLLSLALCLRFLVTSLKCDAAALQSCCSLYYVHLLEPVLRQPRCEKAGFQGLSLYALLTTIDVPSTSFFLAYFLKAPGVPQHLFISTTFFLSFATFRLPSIDLSL
jgi:hypothetical protein